MTTDQRIENLEKGLASARRFNRWLLAVVGLALAVWILAGIFGPTMAAAPAGGGVAKEIRANSFVVEDENGKVRAWLRMSKNGPRLDLCDENGKGHVLLDGRKDTPNLCLYDENGKGRAILVVTNDGSALTLADENGKPSASLQANKDGPGLSLYGEISKGSAILTASKEGPGRLTLFDEKGKVIWLAP